LADKTFGEFKSRHEFLGQMTNVTRTLVVIRKIKRRPQGRRFDFSVSFQL